MRLRFGYGFESGDANGPRNVQNQLLSKEQSGAPFDQEMYAAVLYVLTLVD